MPGENIFKPEESSLLDGDKTKKNEKNKIGKKCINIHNYKHA